MLRLLLAAACVVCAGAARAEDPGSWRYQDDTKPVKVVVIGGSVSAYPAGGFAQWLPEVCANIEVVNRGKAKLGAYELRQRFVAQVLKNRRLDDEAKKKSWLLFLGGLNSVGSPEATNVEVAKTLKLAKEAGLGTFGVSVNPWGSDQDHRWQGVDGVAYFEHTQKTVDFIMGRLTPKQAFGRDHEATSFEPGELPDIAVDLWDGTLRDRNATPRDEAKMKKLARRSPWVKKRMQSVPEGEGERILQQIVGQATELPRWYMKPEFVGFDSIHPNALGHREIAKAICAKAPPSWGCSCATLEHLAWDRRSNKPKTL